MANHEQSNSEPEPSARTGLRGLWDFILRRRQLSANTSVAIPPTPEETPYDIHRGQVTAQVLSFFNAVDAQVAEWIGYEGNIREELYGQVSRLGDPNHGLNLVGLDPSVREYIDGSVFSVIQDGEEDNLWARYDIDCQRGYFTPSVYAKLLDGSIEAKVFHGSEGLTFDHLQLRRVYDNDQVKHIKTFADNLFNPYDPPHPLEISQGWLPMPRVHSYYDNIDAAGNVSLVDGQIIYHPTDHFAGKYSAVDRSIQSIYDRPFPYEQDDRQFLIGYSNRHVSIPFETNIYTELDAIASIMRASES